MNVPSFVGKMEHTTRTRIQALATYPQVEHSASAKGLLALVDSTFKTTATLKPFKVAHSWKQVVAMVKAPTESYDVYAKRYSDILLNLFMLEDWKPSDADQSIYAVLFLESIPELQPTVHSWRQLGTMPTTVTQAMGKAKDEM